MPFRKALQYFVVPKHARTTRPSRHSTAMSVLRENDRFAEAIAPGSTVSAPNSLLDAANQKNCDSHPAFSNANESSALSHRHTQVFEGRRRQSQWGTVLPAHVIPSTVSTQRCASCGRLYVTYALPLAPLFECARPVGIVRLTDTCDISMIPFDTRGQDLDPTPSQTLPPVQARYSEGRAQEPALAPSQASQTARSTPTTSGCPRGRCPSTGRRRTRGSAGPPGRSAHDRRGQALARVTTLTAQYHPDMTWPGM